MTLPWSMTKNANKCIAKAMNLHILCTRFKASKIMIKSKKKRPGFGVDIEPE